MLAKGSNVLGHPETTGLDKKEGSQLETAKEEEGGTQNVCI